MATTNVPKALLLTPNFVTHAFPTSVDLRDSTSKTLCNELEKHKRRSPIFSVDIHWNNEHVATGGNDQYVRLWSLSAIISDAPFKSPNSPIELFAERRHDGTVMCVRWTHGAKSLLATAGDDGSIIIWKLEKRLTTSVTANGTTTASTTTVAISQPLKNNNSFSSGNSSNYPDTLSFMQKLPSMESDVIDLCWSFDNKFLASCSLDNNVSVWNGSSFVQIAKCSHKSFVKGLAFDPAGHYLISQSDDGTAALWSTESWKLHRRITHPFLQCSYSTAGTVMRPSWSPDGEYIACAGAVSEKIHVAVVLPRKHTGLARSAFNLVGHNTAIAVARFGPVCYTYKGEHINLLALGAVDGLLSIWAMCSTPLIVLDKLFTSEITDISWSYDGKILLASSLEGRMAGVLITDVAKNLLGDGAQPISRANLKEYLRKTYNPHLPLSTKAKNIISECPQSTVVKVNSGILVKASVVSDNVNNSICQLAEEKKHVDVVNNDNFSSTNTSLKRKNTSSDDDQSYYNKSELKRLKNCYDDDELLQQKRQVVGSNNDNNYVLLENNNLKKDEHVTVKNNCIVVVPPKRRIIPTPIMDSIVTKNSNFRKWEFKTVIVEEEESLINFQRINSSCKQLLQKTYIGFSDHSEIIVVASAKVVALTTSATLSVLYIYNIEEEQFSVNGFILESAVRQVKVYLTIVAILTADDKITVYEAIDKRQIVQLQVNSITNRLISDKVLILLEAPSQLNGVGFSLSLIIGSNEFYYNHPLKGFIMKNQKKNN